MKTSAFVNFLKRENVPETIYIGFNFESIEDASNFIKENSDEIKKCVLPIGEYTFIAGKRKFNIGDFAIFIDSKDFINPYKVVRYIESKWEIIWDARTYEEACEVCSEQRNFAIE